jgi:hypothetical protein
MGEGARRKGPAGRLVLGLLLFAAGALLLADNAGFDIPGAVWSYWPFFVIALGLSKLAWPGDREERASGYWLVVVGVYGWISTRHLLGLGWGTAWPIVLVAAGLQIAYESLGRSRAGASREADRAR